MAIGRRCRLRQGIEEGKGPKMQNGKKKGSSEMNVRLCLLRSKDRAGTTFLQSSFLSYGGHLTKNDDNKPQSSVVTGLTLHLVVSPFSKTVILQEIFLIMKVCEHS